jgi:hypothetical protein
MRNPLAYQPIKRLEEIMSVVPITSRTRAAASSLVVVTLSLVFVHAVAAEVPTPTLTGPIASQDIPGTSTHNYIFFASNHPLAEQGYTEKEYFYSGSAYAYSAPSALATGAPIAGPYPYTTRMVVRAPADKRRFNGVVLVEWLNVTNIYDADNLWFYDWEHILGEGYAWVGISAQTIGVGTLRTWNPDRYGSLNVAISNPPSTVTDADALSYDIFSQAGEAIRHPGSVNVLDGLQPKLIIATGESQSAVRLASYINTRNPLGNVYNGFLLLSTVGEMIRPNLSQPVFKVLTEYDVQAAEASIRQPPTSHYRSWEIAGQSHVDQHLRDSREPLELRDNPLNYPIPSSGESQLAPTCGIAQLGTLQPAGDVINTAFGDLVNWIRSGEAPPIAPYIKIESIGSPGPAPSVIARNSLGVAEGGIRLPQVEVPTYLNVGTNSGPAGSACVRWGYHLPFSVDELNELYATYHQYVSKVTKSANGDVTKGFIQPADARQLIYQAIQSGVGSPTEKQKERELQSFFTSQAPK